METFSAMLAHCVGNSPHKGQWHGALMFSLIRARINAWVNTRQAGDLRRHRAYYDVIEVADVSLISENMPILCTIIVTVREHEIFGCNLVAYKRCQIIGLPLNIHRCGSNKMHMQTGLNMYLYIIVWDGIMM